MVLHSFFFCSFAVFALLSTFNLIGLLALFYIKEKYIMQKGFFFFLLFCVFTIALNHDDDDGGGGGGDDENLDVQYV